MRLVQRGYHRSRMVWALIRASHSQRMVLWGLRISVWGYRLLDRAKELRPIRAM